MRHSRVLLYVFILNFDADSNRSFAKDHLYTLAFVRKIILETTTSIMSGYEHKSPQKAAYIADHNTDHDHGVYEHVKNTHNAQTGLTIDS